MSLLTDLMQRVANLTNRLNEIGANSKTTEEMPLMEPIQRDSLVRLSKAGQSYKTSVQGLIAEIGLQDMIIQIGEIVLVPNGPNFDLKIPAVPNPIWRINGVEYTKNTETLIPIPFASTDKYRVDIIVANTSGGFDRIEGVEDSNVGLPPDLPPNTIEVTRLNIFGTVIGEPNTPDTNGFITKSSKRYRYVSLQQTTPKVMLLSKEYTTYIIRRPNTDPNYTTILNGFSTFLPSGIYDGMDIYIRIDSDEPITLKHNVSGVTVPYWFSENIDLVLKKNDLVHLKYREAENRVEFVGIGKFNPTEHDLDEFQNAGTDPYAHISDIPDPVPPFDPNNYPLDVFPNPVVNPFIREDDLPEIPLINPQRILSTSSPITAADNAHTLIATGTGITVTIDVTTNPLQDTFMAFFYNHHDTSTMNFNFVATAGWIFPTILTLEPRGHCVMFKIKGLNTIVILGNE